jgi:acetyl-CoA C-acetyltransferase
MTNKIKVAVVGSAVYAPRVPERTSLEEALHAVTQAALRDAGIVIDDVDGIVVASCDQLEGRAISVMMASGSVGGVGRDISATPSASEHAFVLGCLRVRSGMYRTQLVISWSPLESDSINQMQRLGADPYFHRRLPLDEMSSFALQANALEAAVPDLREAAIATAQKNRQHGFIAYPEYASAPRESALIRDGRVLRWPITDGMVSPPAFAAVAAVLASDDWIAGHPERKPAWVNGMGWASETGFLGDRDLSRLDSLTAAAAQAYREAGVSDQNPRFDIAEVADPTPYQELLSLGALGLCPRERWVAAAKHGDFAAGGALPVNLSGGAITFNPVFCNGLMRIVESANQVRGCAGRHQRSGVRNALAHGASGFAMQYNTVIVLGQSPVEVRQ